MKSYQSFLIVVALSISFPISSNDEQCQQLCAPETCLKKPGRYVTCFESCHKTAQDLVEICENSIKPESLTDFNNLANAKKRILLLRLYEQKDMHPEMSFYFNEEKGKLGDVNAPVDRHAIQSAITIATNLRDMCKDLVTADRPRYVLPVLREQGQIILDKVHQRIADMHAMLDGSTPSSKQALFEIISHSKSHDGILLPIKNCINQFGSLDAPLKWSKSKCFTQCTAKTCESGKKAECIKNCDKAVIKHCINVDDK